MVSSLFSDCYCNCYLCRKHYSLQICTPLKPHIQMNLLEALRHSDRCIFKYIPAKNQFIQCLGSKLCYLALHCFFASIYRTQKIISCHLLVAFCAQLQQCCNISTILCRSINKYLRITHIIKSRATKERAPNGRVWVPERPGVTGESNRAFTRFQNPSRDT